MTGVGDAPILRASSETPIQIHRIEVAVLPANTLPTLAALFGPELLRQIAALCLITVLSRFALWRVDRVIQRSRQRLAESTIGHDIPQLVAGLQLLGRVIFPTLAWLVTWFAASVFRTLAWTDGLLQRALTIIAAWIVYRLIASMLELILSEEHAAAWRRYFLRPVVVVLALLVLLGLTDSILSRGWKWQETEITIGALLIGTGIVLLSVILSRSSRHYLGTVVLPKAGFEPALSQAVSTIAAYFIIVTGLVLALDVVGMDLTAFAVVAGGLSVGIGFGLQEIFSNFVSGFIMLFERSIGPGDVVGVGDSIGAVEAVGIRSTRIRTVDNVELIVPNSHFLNDVLTNYTRSDTKVRVNVGVGVRYDSDPDAVAEALLAAADLPIVLKVPPPEVELIGFGESSLDFSLEAWTDKPLAVAKFQSQLRFGILRELRARGIEIPFPQRDVNIRNPEA